MTKTTKKKLNYQSALERLEEIIQKMEDAEVSLEESIALYKEGIELSVFCSESLQTAEQEITVLQKTAEGLFVQKPFNASATGKTGSVATSVYADGEGDDGL